MPIPTIDHWIPPPPQLLAGNKNPYLMVFSSTGRWETPTYEISFITKGYYASFAKPMPGDMAVWNQSHGYYLFATRVYPKHWIADGTRWKLWWSTHPGIGIDGDVAFASAFTAGYLPPSVERRNPDRIPLLRVDDQQIVPIILRKAGMNKDPRTPSPKIPLALVQTPPPRTTDRKRRGSSCPPAPRKRRATMVELAEIDDSPSKLRAERVKRFTEEDSSAVVAYKLAAKLELYDQADGGFESKNGRDKGTPDYSSDDYSEGSGKDTD